MGSPEPGLGTYVVTAILVIALVAFAIWARRIEKHVGPPSEPTGEPAKRFGFFSLFGDHGPNPPSAM